LAVLGRFSDKNGPTTMEEYAQLHWQEKDSIEPDTQGATLEVQVSTDSQRLTTALSSLEIAAREHHVHLSFLRTLYFGEIPLRYNAIESAHKSTCEWIFNRPSNRMDGQKQLRFVDWLHSQDDVFWINGKPGSGKSTLLKFVSFHRDTQSHLEQWAAGTPVLIGKFFFWNAGTPLQKSREGLLRSIIFSLLRQSPALLRATIIQTKSTMGDEFEDTTDLDYLFNLYEFIVEQAKPSKICLFVDGLDEFHEPGQPLEQLILCLRALQASPHVKMCVSSRPWPEFEDEFGRQWSLKVEDLTRDDIRRYVLDKFNEHAQFPKLVQMDPSYSSFVDTIVKDAQGVFLWVYLVVREILQGLTFNDSLATLRSRLQSFPPDLENFFRHILGTIPQAYQKHTARYFKVTLESPRPLPIALYSFLEELEHNAEFAVNMEIDHGREDTEAVRSRVALARRRLDGRSRGLLECRDDDYYVRVDFLHRTVRDFLVGSVETKASLWDPLGPNDQTGLRMCHAILAYTKTSGRVHYSPTAFSADSIEGHWLLGALFSFGNSFAGDSEDRRRLLYHVLSKLEQTAFPDQRGTCLSLFLGMASCFDMSWYVQRRLSEIPSSYQRRKLLRTDTSVSALEFVLGRRIYGVAGLSQHSVQCIKELLEAGANPNAECKHHRGASNVTVLALFLTDFVRRASSEDTDYQESVKSGMELLLAHGTSASTKGRLWGEYSGGSRVPPTVKSVIEEYMGAQETKRLLRQARFKRIGMGPLVWWTRQDK